MTAVRGTFPSARDELLDLPVIRLAEMVRTGEASAVEVTSAALARIDRGRPLGAFLTVQGERSLAAAEALDARRARGETLGPLAGVPIGVKDPICTKDVPTTAGSKILTRARKDASEPELDPSGHVGATDRARASSAPSSFSASRKRN